MSTTIQYHLRHNENQNLQQLYQQEVVLIPYSILFFIDAILDQINQPGLHKIQEALLVDLGEEIIRQALNENQHLHSFQQLKLIIIAIYKANGFGILNLQSVSETGGRIVLNVKRLGELTPTKDSYSAPSVLFHAFYLKGMFCQLLNVQPHQVNIRVAQIKKSTIEMDFMLSTMRDHSPMKNSLNDNG